MRSSQYSPSAKAEALQLLAEVGKAEASKRTGIPEGTIASWGARNGVTFRPDSPTTVAERKSELVLKLLPLAAKLVDRLEQRIGSDDASLRDLAQTLMIVVDRVQLLTGQATARTETTIAAVEVEAARARAATVLDELAAKRVA